MTLTPEQRVRLDALADVVVPADATHPSASAADERGHWLDRILAERPDLVAPLGALIDGSAGRDPAAAVQALEDDDDTAYQLLLLVVHLRYYMNPRVRRSIGYPGQVAAPQLPGEAEAYLREAGIDVVIARGPMFQAVPEDGAA